jgi:HEAT repeat protein
MLFFSQISIWATPELYARRLQAHLLIGDVESANTEARSALKQYPEDALVYEWAIKSFAAAGEETEMMDAWEKFHGLVGEKAFHQDLLEEMCWSFLKKGKSSSSLSTQVIAILGAAMARDMRAVPFLLAGLRHSNAKIRAISLELAAVYGDYPLREEICRLFRTEKILEVKIRAIEALGELEIEEALSELIHCVASPKTGPKEKLAAIKAIVSMRDQIGKEELQSLAISKRAGLRELACEVISHCCLDEEDAILRLLIRDPHPDVAAAALKTWGLLGKKATEEVKELAVAKNPQVGIAASWVWLIDHPDEGEKAMLKWIEHDQDFVRALAAAAVASSGSYGMPFAKELMEKSDDLYVKANLALGLASQREAVEEISATLEQALRDCKDKWMFTEEGLFRALVKSDLNHDPAIANFPEVMNQTTRLEILNLLAILEAPMALDAIKDFLKERDWGVTGLAAETLLGEGDESAIELVRSLLDEADLEVRTEAALVLATWAKDYTAVPILIDVYSKADRQKQLKILESLGRIGDRQALPFLLLRLKDPSLIIRMVAACVIIQTLNH